MGEEEQAATRAYIDQFYQYNNNAPTRPFQVDVDAMLDRMPIKLETIHDWVKRQNWTLTNKPRPPAG